MDAIMNDHHIPISMTVEKSTDCVPEILTQLLLDAMQSVGIDLHRIFKNAKFAYQVNHKGAVLMPSVSQQKFAPIYRKCMKALTLHVCRESGRAAPTLEDYKLFCYCTINCHDLGAVIARSIAFLNALNGRAGNLSLNCDERKAVLSIDTYLQGNSYAAMVCDVFRLYFFYKFFSWMIGEPMPLIQATLAHRPQLDAGAATALVNCPVYFNGIRNSLVFSQELLRRPVERTYQDLVQLLEVSAIELAPLPAAARLSTHLENFFRKALLEEKPIPTADRVAYLLGQSGPTLRRHLAQESTSFQHIIDKCRIDRAVQLLSQPKLTIDEISYSLGFSAPSGFSRAFKDWTGYPPSEYRKRLCDSQASAQ
jgi:AraC-like DNA-binding protein